MTNGTSYQVQVRAGNTHGDGPWSPSATLKAGLPAAPAAPTLTPGSATLTATWVAPSANGGTLSGFKVQYKRSSDTAWTTHTFSSTGSTTSTSIGSLTNGTAYDVQVRATNEHGDGPWSPSATLKAGVPVASAAPTLTVRHQSLAVSWTAPANNGSAITDYDVQYSSDSGSTWTEWNAGNTSTDTNTTITGLTNATTYQVQVRAANTHGDGPWSPPASATPANTAPGKPAAPSASLNTNVSVTWTAPTYTGGAAITDYDLRWSSDNGTTWTEETDAESTLLSRNVSVADLAGGASYVFSVRAQNSVGNGPWSDASSPSVALPARPPDAPGQPTVTSGNGSLTVTWTAPADNGAAITDYDVEYRTWSQAKSGPWVHWKPSETSVSTTTTITGTDNGTHYRTRVKARNSAGDSDWSALSDAKSSGAPAVPDAPILTPGLGRLTVTWAAPADHGSPIINYDVRYRTVGASNWLKLDYVSGVQLTKILPDETSGPADPIDTGELTHADMTKVGLSFTRESVGSGANEKFGVYKLNDGIKQVRWSFIASGSVSGNVVLRFAATKPSADNLTTHGWTDCDPSSAGCSPNYDHGPIPKNGYVWAYTTENSTITFAAWLLQSIDVAALSRSLESTTLTTGTEYEVQVRASNTHGDSGWSPSAKTTVGGPSAVRYLCAHPKNGALLMDWSAPATTNGTITDYDLRYREVGTTTWTEWKATETSTTRSATITGLTNGKQYEVQARAENANGTGPWSASEIMRAGVPGAFSRPSITPRFWDLTATWDAPADTGGSAITDYDVQYLNSDELPGDSNGIPVIPNNANGNPDWDLLPWIDWQASTVSTARSAQITGLDAVTAYWVRARAVNSNGDGVWSEPAADRTYMPNRIKDCSPTGTTTLPLGWYCEINAGVDGVGSFDSSSITAGTGLIFARASNGADQAMFIAVNPQGGSATVTTTKAGATVNTFSISVTPFAIASAVASDATPTAGESFTVTVTLQSPLHFSPKKNKIDGNKNPVAGKYSRSWVTLEMPTGWTAVNPDEGTATAPVEVVKYFGKTVSFTVSVPANATGGAQTITVKAHTIDLPANCATDPNCLQNAHDEETASLSVTVASGLVSMMVSGMAATTPPAAVGSVSASRSNGSIVASWPVAATSTKYHVNYTNDTGHSKSWTVAAMDHPTNSITIADADDTKSYIVAVRAGNAAGWSGWVNSAAVPAAVTTPGNVSGLSASRSDGSIVASWDAVTGATEYHVNYTTNGGNSWSVAAMEHPTNSITIANADNAKSYIVAVRAGNSAGWSGWVNSDSVPPVVTPPGNVTGLTASRSNGNIVASWDAVAGATGYHVVYSDDGKASWTRVATDHSGTSYNITGADASLTYVVGVQAVNTAGGSGWVNSNTVPPVVTPPGNVTGLTASRSDGSIVASWDAAAGATGYHVVYSDDGKASWTRVATDHSGTSYTITGADASLAYVVGVQAVNSAGGSGWVNSNTVPAVTPPPGSVGSVTATHHGATLSVTWDAADHATGYDVVYSADGKASWTRAATNHSGVSYTLDNADSGKTYVFGVRAVNESGASGWTNSAPASHSGSG